MFEFIYIPIILLLYLRTWKYHYLIDDPVPRDGYLYEGPRRPDPVFYDARRPILATITNIGVFIATCGYVHYLWGWKPALLFAVMPLSVTGVAWITGNYYMSTVLLILATHATILYPTDLIFKIILSCAFYGASLNSTVSALSYLPIGIYCGGWYLIVPFVFFITGKRWTYGLKIRRERHENLNIEAGKFRLRNLLNVPKTIAYYIFISFFPYRLGFFHTFGKTDEFYTRRALVYSLLLCVMFFIWGLQLDPLMTIFWFLSIGLFSQFITYGQFISERYTMLANVAFCVVLSLFLQDYITIYTILCTLWFAKSWSYIKAWRHNEDLFRYSMEVFPESPENFNNLACYYLDKQDVFSAIRPLQVAEVLTSGNKYGIYVNLMKCYKASRNYKEAYKYANLALDHNCPNDRREQLENIRNEIRTLMFEKEELYKTVKKLKSGRKTLRRLR